MKILQIDDQQRLVTVAGIKKGDIVGLPNGTPIGLCSWNNGGAIGVIVRGSADPDEVVEIRIPVMNVVDALARLDGEEG